MHFLVVIITMPVKNKMSTDPPQRKKNKSHHGPIRTPSPFSKTLTKRELPYGVGGEPMVSKLAPAPIRPTERQALAGPLQDSVPPLDTPDSAGLRQWRRWPVVGQRRPVAGLFCGLVWIRLRRP